MAARLHTGEDMRPLPQMSKSKRMWNEHRSTPRGWVWAGVLLATSAWTLGCGGGGAGSVASPSPTPPPNNSSVSVTVTPSAGSVLLGETVSFSVSVSNATDTSVTWAVNGIIGGSSQAGTISADGVYAAPSDLPAGGTVQVTAISHADSSKSVTVISDVSVVLAQSTASVELGTTQAFQASIQSQGRPDTAVRWSLVGPSCPNACGYVNTNGNYTAPQILPSAANVRLTATSVADSSKQSNVNLTITSHFRLQLSAPANLQAGAATSLTATLTPVAGSNPSAGLSWSLQGSGCTGSSCGSLVITTTQGAGVPPIANSAVYTAPLTPPQPDTVIVTVTPQADPSKAVQATIAILQPSGFSITPPTATLAANHHIILTVAQSGSSGGTLNWSVNGVAGGNSTYGQICVVGSSPCQPVTTSSATQVDYVAPGTIPAPNPVSVTVSSTTDPNLTSSAQITVLNHLVVSVLPNSVTLAPGGVQRFSATVLGCSNQIVTWELQGAACGAVGNCGSLDAAGTYTAPLNAPSPNSVQVVGVSQDDPTQSGTANITIFNGPNVQTIHPASVFAGGLNGFTLQVDGSGFISTNSGAGSTVLIGGTARVTACTSANACTAPVTEADVAQAGTLMVQVQNPGGTNSNAVQLVIAAPNTADDSIALTTTAPAATGKDITAVEPTTAGIDSSDDNLDLTVAAIGSFNPANNTCSLAGNPIALVRPSSGASAADICLFSQAGFDTSMTYTVSGPGDVAVISKQPAGLGIIHLTLQLPATAAPGARTLFIQNANLDRTAASGVLEIR